MIDYLLLGTLPFYIAYLLAHLIAHSLASPIAVLLAYTFCSYNKEMPHHPCTDVVNKPSPRIVKSAVTSRQEAKKKREGRRRGGRRGHATKIRNEMWAAAKRAHGAQMDVSSDDGG
jgi:hypothetical protein